MHLNYFSKTDLGKGIKEFFQQLSIPFSTVADNPLIKTDFFTDTNPNLKYLSSIELVYIPISISSNSFQKNLFASPIDLKNIKPDYDGLFIFGIQLKKQDLTLSLNEIASITRAVSREFKNNPVVVFFLLNGRLSIANCQRTPYKTNREGEKPGKVSVLRDIDIEKPHAGHLRIIEDLNISNKSIQTFRELNEYWLSVFDTSVLNKRFYKDISNWYFWALKKVKFPFELPKGSKESKQELLPITLIRLLTRLIFVWFLKEKKLIPQTLFEVNTLKEMLHGFSVDGKKTIFYTSILQNLFFGTLNTYRNVDAPDESLSRKFRTPERDKKGKTDDYMVTNLYRYETNFKDTNKLLELLKDIPFLNGGLFECLDKREGKEDAETRLDCFSDVEKKQPNIPDYLFFSEGNEMDLSEDYGDKKKNAESVNGMIRILEKYKFTVEENTPLEEEIALDPELLGKVFENLLASFNPETSTTARKQTGSFYTPREIVNYMVEESLVAYYKNALLKESVGHTILVSNENVMFTEAAADKKGQYQLTTKLDSNNWTGKEEELEKKLHSLLADGEPNNPFSIEDTEKLVRATSNCKILDPACGSGAFPMGVLHKMVFVLRKIDPENKRWKQEQLERNELEEKKKSIEVNFREHEADYARKLYLIENCIYGIDIQPIAVQITKLRFFISLIVEQKINPERKNLGIIPLPNLETKFVAANSLVGLEKPGEGELVSKKDPKLLVLENQLNEVRKKYFYSRSRSEKIKLKEEDKKHREAILEYFLSKNKTFKDGLESILKIGKLPKESIKTIIQYINDTHSESFVELQKLVGQLCKESKMDSGISKKAVEECKKYFPAKSASEIAAWDPYNQNAHADWFDSEYMFGVLDGFDVVIGNPPYVQLQKDGGLLAKLYEKLGYQTFTRMGDIYSLFYEKGIHLLNENGLLCYITSNKWMRADYGKHTRKFFVEKTKPLLLVDFGMDLMIFENAVVHTNILLLSCDTFKYDTFEGDPPVGRLQSNRVQSNRVQYAVRIDSDFKMGMNISDYVQKHSVVLENLTEESWVIGDANTMKIKQKVEQQGKKLKDWDIQINFGIKTGFNEAFIIDGKTKEELIKKDKRNQEIIKPLLRGRDTRKFHCNFADVWLINTHNGIKEKGIQPINVKKEYPEIYKYLDSKEFKPQIEERLDQGEHWTNLRNCAYWQDFEKPKIIYPVITKDTLFTYDQNLNYYTNDKTFIMTGDKLKFLISFFNSMLFKYIFKNNFPSLGTGVELRKVFFEQIPVKVPTPSQEVAFNTLVDHLLSAKAKDKFADTSKQEAQIDALVFHLYGLTEKEMLTVLDSFPKLSEVEKLRIQNYYRDIENGVLK